MCHATQPPAFIQWGNQEPLWKVSEAAKSANSETFDKLAKPKKDFASKKLQSVAQYEFSCGRGSPIIKANKARVHFRPIFVKLTDRRLP